MRIYCYVCSVIIISCILCSLYLVSLHLKKINDTAFFLPEGFRVVQSTLVFRNEDGTKRTPYDDEGNKLEDIRFLHLEKIKENKQ